jgi:hypothetical protein
MSDRLSGTTNSPTAVQILQQIGVQLTDQLVPEPDKLRVDGDAAGLP